MESIIFHIIKTIQFKFLQSKRSEQYCMHNKGFESYRRRRKFGLVYVLFGNTHKDIINMVGIVLFGNKNGCLGQGSGINKVS